MGLNIIGQLPLFREVTYRSDTWVRRVIFTGVLF